MYYLFRNFEYDENKYDYYIFILDKVYQTNRYYYKCKDKNCAGRLTLTSNDENVKSLETTQE